MLAAKQLTLWRGPLCLFDNLSFEVGGGCALLVRGSNGSGKTTLLRVLCGLTRPETGSVDWNDESIESCRAAYGAQLAYYGHLTGLKTDLTVIQNLAFAARLFGRRGEPWRDFLETLNLSLCANLPVRYLSAGQQRRTALARVLMSRAALWIMDEPFANLDQAGRTLLDGELARHLQAGGMAIVAAHHGLELPTDRLTQIVLGDMSQ